MKNRTSSRTGLFLMELILAVLLFSLSSVLCIQMFVKSHTLSKNSVELNHSILWAQNISETFYGCNGNASDMSELFENCNYEMDSDQSEYLTLFFDENFTPITLSGNPAEKSYYQLTALITPENDGLINCYIEISKSGSTNNIYELTLSLFPSKEVPYES